MARIASSFYPPRARWYSPVFTSAGRWRRRLALDRIPFLPEVSLQDALLCAFIPGMAFYLRRPRMWGPAALGFCGLLLLVIIVWFGYPAATLAFGLLLAIHASGLALLYERSLATYSFRSRICFITALMIALAGLLYLPARNVILKHWLFPLRLANRVVVVRREAPSAQLRRGEVVAYSFEGFCRGELIVSDGFGLGPLLGLPGDQIRFAESTFEVNGVAQPRLALMPQTGDWVVPQKHWFVWPQFDISSHGNVSVTTLGEPMLKLATISESQFLGKPCGRWLWRRQFKL